MSVLSSISLNLMSELTPKQDEDSTGNLTDIKSVKQSSRKSTRLRNFLPPFTRAVYELFMNALKEGEKSYPTSKQLREIGFAKNCFASPRQKFRQLLPRLSLGTVDGSLVFSDKPTQEVLISKRTRKIVVTVEEAKMVVKRAHLTGSNRREGEIDETRQKHKTYAKTVKVLQEDFTTNRRDFGIEKLLIRRVVDHCRSCALAEISSDEGTPVEAESQEDLSNCTTSKKSVEAPLKPDQKMPSASVCEPRFSSMIAHIPDRQCIWYDRNSIASSSNRYTKLLLVLNEMRGEMALAIRGNIEAKQRFETKLYCCQLLIKDYLKSLEQTTITGGEDLEITTQLQSLLQEYQEANQSSMFELDLRNLLTSVKNNKLILPQLLVTQIEDYINPTSIATTKLS